MKNSIIKKALALVCALAMVFTLCACSSNGSDNGSGDSAKVYNCLLYTSPSPRD